MEKILFAAAIGMAAFLDFAIGVLIVSLVARVYNSSLQLWHLVLGGALAFLPDFDMIIPLVRKKYAGAEDHHASLMHRPILVLPAVTFAAWWLGGTPWAIVAFLCVFWHFVHDTKQFGDAGLAWFWPFSKKEWSLVGPEDPPQNPKVVDWIYGRWLTPSPMSFLEITIGATALAIGSYLVFGYRTAEVFFVLPLIGAFFVWGLFSTIKK